MESTKEYLLILFLLIVFSDGGWGMRYDISVSRDDRSLIEFTRFGYQQGGTFHIQIRDVKVCFRLFLNFLLPVLILSVFLIVIIAG